jgi:ferredoxin
MQEHQFGRHDVVILGILDDTPVGLKVDVEVGRVATWQTPSKWEKEIARLMRQDLSVRFEWWQAQFSRCLRCYACRQVCPFCYCEQCIADQNQPQWIEKSPSRVNNLAWNLIRAYHLIGRCTNCGECDRVCPAQIPLGLIHTQMAAEVHAAFGQVAGSDPEAVPALITFRPDDAEEFVR